MDEKNMGDLAGSFLARRVLSNLGFRIAIITILFSVLSYYISYIRFQNDAQQKLAEFIQIRSQQESDLFIQAQKNVSLVRNSFLRQLPERKNDHAVLQRFDALFQKDSDNVWRVRTEHDNHRYKATLSIFPPAKIDSFFKQEVLLAYDLISQYGPAFRLRYHSTFIDLNNNDATILYSPDVNYARSNVINHASSDIETETTAYAAANSLRDKIYWTDTYYDRHAMQWLISVMAPIVQDNHYYGRVGMDVLLSRLIERANTQTLQDSYNMIIGRGGELIAHPNKMQQIRDANGHLVINYLQDPDLSEIYDVMMKNTQTKGLLEIPNGRLLFGAAPLQGTNWFFVTVFPKKVLQKKAAAAASVVLILGVLMLLAQVILVARVLKKDIVQPLKYLQNAVEKMTEGKETLHLEDARLDEFGDLARAFDGMANQIRRYQEELEMQVKVRTDVLARHNQELGEHNTTLMRLNQEKNNILAIVVHDLKNPLASIQGISNILIQSFLSWPKEKTTNKLKAIRALSDRTLQVLYNVLDWEAIENGKYPIHLENISLQTMLQTLRQDYQMNLETKQQVLTIDDTQEKVLADPAALWQVLDNLLSNACKYTPHHGQIFIHIRSEVNQIRIEIEDQGPGIAKHELDRLFQKFSKLSAKPTGNEHSTGLGLFIVKHLLGLMQGKVVCESQFGYGAKFIVYLPAATEVTQA